MLGKAQRGVATDREKACSSESYPMPARELQSQEADATSPQATDAGRVHSCIHGTCVRAEFTPLTLTG